MDHEEIIAMANAAAARHGHTYEPEPADGTVEFLTSFAALVAAKERERLFGKAQHDGEMRLMLHRWEGGQCFADAEHFTAAQTHWGPNDLLQMAVDRMDERLAAGIAAAIRARGTKEGV